MERPSQLHTDSHDMTGLSLSGNLALNAQNRACQGQAPGQTGQSKKEPGAASWPAVRHGAYWVRLPGFRLDREEVEVGPGEVIKQGNACDFIQTLEFCRGHGTEYTQRWGPPVSYRARQTRY